LIPTALNFAVELEELAEFGGPSSVGKQHWLVATIVAAQLYARLNMRSGATLNQGRLIAPSYIQNGRLREALPEQQVRGIPRWRQEFLELFGRI
jgi:hypothetical protein